MLTAAAVLNRMNLPQHTAGSRARSNADLVELLERFADAWNRHDLFTFRDGTIAVKNSYRKNRPPI